MERIQSVWAQIDFVKDLPPAILVSLCAGLLIFAGWSISNGWKDLKGTLSDHDALLAKATEIMDSMQRLLAVHEEKHKQMEKRVDEQGDKLAELQKDFYLVNYRRR